MTYSLLYFLRDVNKNKRITVRLPVFHPLLKEVYQKEGLFFTVLVSHLPTSNSSTGLGIPLVSAIRISEFLVFRPGNKNRIEDKQLQPNDGSSRHFHN